MQNKKLMKIQKKMNKDKRLYQIMHKYGKLTSVNSDNPHECDKMFIKEIKGALNRNE